MASILTVSDAKSALRLRDNDVDRDDLLESFIEGVTDVVEDSVGWVVPRTVVVEFDQFNAQSAALVSGNVLSLTSGVEIQSGATVDISTLYVDINGVLHNSLANTALCARPWRLTLEVGMDPIPEAILRGAAEILIEAWSTQRNAPGVADSSRPFLVPYRAAAWFASYQNGPSVG